MVTCYICQSYFFTEGGAGDGTNGLYLARNTLVLTALIVHCMMRPSELKYHYLLGSVKFSLGIKFKF